MFIDLDAAERPVLFVTLSKGSPPTRGKECLTGFRAFLTRHGGQPAASPRWCATCQPLSLPPQPRPFPSPR